MMALDRPEMLVGAGAGSGFPSSSFHDGGSPDGLGTPAVGNATADTSMLVLPSLFATAAINERIHVGIGLRSDASTPQWLLRRRFCGILPVRFVQSSAIGL
jgi:hypothetical protein